MIRTIGLCGRSVSYTLTRKAVRNINVRVRADGSVAVSAPSRVPLETIEDFLRERAHAVVRAIEQCEKAAPPVRHFVDGETVPCRGVACALFVHKGEKNTAALGHGVFHMTVTDPDDEALKAATWEIWKRSFTEETVLPLCQAMHRRVAPQGAPFPTIKFRRMKTRWGSCCPAKNTVTFNTALAEHTLEETAYVVCHEFTHFLHPNHSAAFYAALESFMPDWKRWRDALNARG